MLLVYSQSFLVMEKHVTKFLEIKHPGAQRSINTYKVTVEKLTQFFFQLY